MTLKLAYVIRHLEFEGLGNLEDILISCKFTIKYEEDIYPFLKIEIAILETRLSSDYPTLGICLGAQLITKALGSKVYRGSSKEIGWSALHPTNIGKQNFFPHFDSAKTDVLHWHGNAFDLPQGTVLQASTAIYKNQAFTYKSNTLSIKFHSEIIGQNIERLLIDRALETSLTKDVTIQQWRVETRRNSGKLLTQASRLWEK